MNEWRPGQVKAIIFDMDGTLYSFPYCKHFLLSCRLWSSLHFLRHLSASRSHVRKELFEDGPHLKMGLYLQLAQRSGRTINQAREWYDRKFWPAFIAMLKRRAGSRTGLAEVLAALQQAGVKLVLLSDYDHLEERLAALGLSAGLFDQLLTSEDFGQLKPAAAPFIAALDSVNVAPAQGLVVGDSPQLDEAGARAANIPFLGISDRAEEGNYYKWPTVKAKLEEIVVAAVPISGAEKNN